MRKKQRGLATLLATVVLLISISLMAFYTSQVSVTEQKISSNHYRTQQAFEAAEAGLNSAISNLDMGIIKHAICTGPVIAIAGICEGLNSSRGVGETGHFLGDNQLIVMSDGADYRLSFETSDFHDNIIDITLSGFASDNPSEDNSPNRIVKQSVILTPILNYHPPSALIARNTIQLDANESITNKTEKVLSSSWSGGGTFHSINTLVDVTSVDGNTVGGYYQNDPFLALLSVGNDSIVPVKKNVFFQNFFSDSVDRMKSRSLFIDCTSGCNTEDLKGYVSEAGSPLSHAIIWIDANNAGIYETLIIDEAINIGTGENPVLLIVEGGVELKSSDFNFIGIMYAMKDIKNEMSGDILGSLISEASIKSDGEWRVTYSDAVFKKMNDNLSSFTRVTGSWRDF